MCLNRQKRVWGWWVVCALTVSGCGDRRPRAPVPVTDTTPITVPVETAETIDAGAEAVRDEGRLPPPAWSDPMWGELGATRERSPQAQRGARPIAASGRLAVPVAGLRPNEIRDNYDELRGSRPHQALDIAAERGTPVVAVDDGRIRKLFTSDKGGLTIYQFNTEGDLCYYYAHLESYAQGLSEGELVRRGEVIGYVGTSGNAPKDAPHLHFEVTRVGPQGEWYGGEPLNPYPMMVAPN